MNNQSDTKQPASSKELIKQITLFQDEEKYKEAFEMVTEALKDYPNDASLWFLKARSLNGLSRIEESLAACDKAIEYGFDKPTVVYNYKCRILRDQEHFEEALKECERSLSIDSTSVEALMDKAAILSAIKGDLTSILPIANRIIQLDPKHAGGWNLKATALHLQNENKEAEKAVNKALEIEPNFAAALAMKASILGVTGRKSEAGKLMMRAAELDPDKNTEDNMIQGMKKGMVEEAKRSLTYCWVWTIAIGGILSVFALNAGLAAIILIPIIFYAAFSLYWGWGSIWPKWRNMIRGFGSITDNGLILLFILLLSIEIVALLAILYGAFVGLGRYKDLKLIAANN